MDLTPLGDRVLIKPDPVKTTTGSGLVLVEDDPDETTGVVVAVGRPTHPRKQEAFDCANFLDGYASHSQNDYVLKHMRESSQLLRELTGRECVVQVGQRVGFARYGGQELRLNDERYLLLREADIMVVLEPEESLT